MKSPDWQRRQAVANAPLRRLFPVAAVVGLALAAAGCAQSMSPFAMGGPGPSAESTSLTSEGAGSVTTQPAVLTEETTVPVSRNGTDSTAPMAFSPRAPQATSAEQPETGIAASANNLNRVPEQPKSKLLSPAERAKVIAELEALAKKQSTELGKDQQSTDCSNQKVDPAQRVVGATGDGGC
jgi:hypothetical protein